MSNRRNGTAGGMQTACGVKETHLRGLGLVRRAYDDFLRRRGIAPKDFREMHHLFGKKAKARDRMAMERARDRGLDRIAEELGQAEQF